VSGEVGDPVDGGFGKWTLREKLPRAINAQPKWILLPRQDNRACAHRRDRSDQLGRGMEHRIQRTLGRDYRQAILIGVKHPNRPVFGYIQVECALELARPRAPATSSPTHLAATIEGLYCSVAIVERHHIAAPHGDEARPKKCGIARLPANGQNCVPLV
jgi:hypothetical protein